MYLLFVLSVLVEGLLPPSVNSIAASNNNNSNNFIHQILFSLHRTVPPGGCTRNITQLLRKQPDQQPSTWAFISPARKICGISACDGQKMQSAGLVNIWRGAVARLGKWVALI